MPQYPSRLSPIQLHKHSKIVAVKFDMRAPPPLTSFGKDAASHLPCSSAALRVTHECMGVRHRQTMSCDTDELCMGSGKTRMGSCSHPAPLFLLRVQPECCAACREGLVIASEMWPAPEQQLR